ncbi:MAG: AAA family ATPase [Cyanobacteria bacterium P01_G01_bin.54]
MLTSLKIENYRCFKSFELESLGRINLLVGKNNSGKTSILEMLEMLLAQNPLKSLEGILERRGEAIEINYHSGNVDSENQSNYLSAQCIFNGRLVIPERKFSTIGESKGIIEKFQVYISDHPDESEERIHFINELNYKLDNGFYVQIIKETNVNEEKAKMSASRQDIERLFLCKVNTLISTSIESNIAKELYGKIMFNAEEDDLLDALQILEPRIERVAPDTSSDFTNFYVKLKSESNRLPLSAMGDGMWRMLSIALTLVTSKGGTVLIDEIDTGLHYTAMVDMWRFIWKVAKKLDVQVFATTHNSDCWQSLAEIAEEEDTSENGITIHRIEKGASRSIVFNEKQMAIAAERGIEVR